MRIVRPQKPALAIAGLYLIVSVLWIYASDSLLTRLVPQAAISSYQTWKGWGFVLVTALLLYLLIRQAVRREQRLVTQLRQERNLVENITQTSPVGILVLDQAGRAIFVNRAIESITGLKPPELLHKPFINTGADRKSGSQVGASEESLPFWRIMATGETLTGAEHKLLRPDGQSVHLSINAAPLRDDSGHIQGLVATLDDISERQQATQRIANLNRVYNVMASTSHCIRQKRSWQSLFQEACRIAVEQGGFRMAWVGLRDERTGLLEPQAWAGHNEGYVESVAVRLNDPERSRGPAGKAFLTGAHAVCNDIEREPAMAVWRKAALRRDYRACAAFPLTVRNKPQGILCLYADTPGFFNTEEMTLLDQLAGDISLAMAVSDQERERDRAESALRESEARYRSLFENQDAIMMLVDPESLSIVDANPAACAYYGIPRGSIAGVRLTRFSRLPHHRIQDLVQTAQSGEGRLFHSVHRRADGQWRDVEIYAGPTEVDGRPLLHSIIHDITDRRNAEDKLRMHSAVIQSIRDGVMITDLNFHILSVNPAFTTITGYNRNDLYGQTVEQLLVRQEGTDSFETIQEAMLRQGHWQGEIWGRRRDGDTFPEWLSLSTVLDESGHPINYVGIFADVSELKENEARLEHLAHYDPLTGLANRSLAYLRLQHVLYMAQRQRTAASVLFIDLDRFKNVNDSLGHDYGDELLVAVAHRIQHQVRGDDTLARFGGDEFLLILEPIKAPQRAAVVARHLLSILDKPFLLGAGHEVYVGASIGISIYPNDGDDVADLIRNAETAMYRAKDLGRNRFCFFTQDMNSDALKTLELEAALRQAIDREELRLHYQPQLDLESGRICGCEALIRWNRGGQGLVSPADFIPLAEQTGLIVPIGDWVIETACRQLQAWEAQGLGHLRVAVNVSARQFLSGQLDFVVAQALERYEVSADRLELELTESMLMENADQAVQLLHELKRVGVRIALDDFGTGYSSLAYLSRFPIDALKIDASFVAGLDTSSHNDAATITAAIIDLAHRMGLRVVAEGVETTSQLSYLRTQGCDEMQGFLFSKPLPQTSFEALCHKPLQMGLSAFDPGQA